MQTMPPTDERLEERFDGIDRRFDEIDRKFEAVDRKFEAVDRKFEAVDRRFDRVEGQIETTRTELKGEISVLQAGLNRVWISMVAGLFGVIAAILVKGG
jgi:tetrahydromethanopterin S-methyltransferase subunit G